MLSLSVYHKREGSRIKKESGTEIGNSLEFDFVIPLNHCVLLDNPKIIERLGFLSQPLIFYAISLIQWYQKDRDHHLQ